MSAEDLETSTHASKDSNDIINKSSLLNSHLKRVQHNQRLTPHTEELLDILGGIDQILIDYLSSDDIHLTAIQLEKIQNLLNNPPPATNSSSDDIDLICEELAENKTTITILTSAPTQILTRPVSISQESSVELKPATNPSPATSHQTPIDTPKTINGSAKSNHNHNSKFTEMPDKQLLYSVSRANTYLRQILGPKISAKIQSIVYSKIIITVQFLITMSWILWAFFESPNWSKAHFIFKIICLILTLIWMIFFLFGVNKRLMSKSLTQFEFWFKLIVCIQFSVCHLWLSQLQYSQLNTGIMELLGDLFFVICLCGIITFFASIDGFWFSRQTKILEGILLSICLTVGAIYYTFVYANDFDDEKATVHLMNNVGFFLPSIQASALRVLTIFIWKQTIVTIIRKDECINIRFAPCIEWVD